MTTDADERIEPRQTRGEKTRARICEAAGDVFLARGYPAATMEEIALAAGVGRSTLYTHFSDKNEILKLISLEYFPRVAVIIGQLPGPRPSRPQIDQWMRTFAEFVLRERTPTLLLIGASFVVDAPPAAREFADKVMHAYSERLPAFAAALEQEGVVGWARATAALRQLSWALMHYADHGAGERETAMLEVAADLFEQVIGGWFPSRT
jgi:AcrR family transcriptional regulator